MMQTLFDTTFNKRGVTFFLKYEPVQFWQALLVLIYAGQEKNFEIQLPSTFQFSVAPTKIFLAQFLFFVAILNLPRALLLVPDFYFLHIIQYGGQYGDRRIKRKQSLLGF